MARFSFKTPYHPGFRREYAGGEKALQNILQNPKHELHQNCATALMRNVQPANHGVHSSAYCAVLSSADEEGDPAFSRKIKPQSDTLISCSRSKFTSTNLAFLFPSYRETDALNFYPVEPPVESFVPRPFCNRIFLPYGNFFAVLFIGFVSWLRLVKSCRFRAYFHASMHHVVAMSRYRAFRRRFWGGASSDSSFIDVSAESLEAIGGEALTKTAR